MDLSVPVEMLQGPNPSNWDSIVRVVNIAYVNYRNNSRDYCAPDITGLGRDSLQ